MKRPICLALLSVLALPVQADGFDPYVLKFTGYLLQSSDGAIATHVADFNGDGFLDVFAVNGGSCAPISPQYCSHLWYGSATGFGANWSLQMVTPTPWHTADGAARIYVGDFNGDGRSDILISRPGDPNGNEIRYGVPKSGFGSPQQVISGHPLHSADGSTQTYIGDFNGDGKADVLRGYADPTWNAIFYSTGSGFTDMQLVMTGHPLQGSGTQSYVADFNGDGKADVLRGYADPTWNAIFYSTGSGFSDMQLVLSGHPLQFADGSTQTYIGDFNGDGKADVLRGYVDPIWNAIWYSTGSGFTDYQPAITPHPLQSNDGATRTYVGDFNGDGKADVLRGYVNPAYNAIWYSTGSGFTDYHLVITPHPLQGDDGATRTYIGDFNRDGRADVLRGYADPCCNAIWHSTGSMQ